MLVRCSENPAPETIGRLAIDMLPETFRTVVVVRRHVPGVGVALRFTQMSPHDRELLHRLMSYVGKDITTGP